VLIHVVNISLDSSSIHSSTINMLSSIQPPRWLREARLQDSFRYTKLPISTYDEKDKEKSGLHINLKGIRWRSPSPGGDRFPITLRMSLARLLAIIATTLLCFVLMIVAVSRHRTRSIPRMAGDEPYPWEKYPKYVVEQDNWFDGC
jgi:hypothetical protein